MKIIYKKLGELKDYENNPRYNDEAVEYVANSIKEFGFKNPIIIDEDGVIVAGHTRKKASELLGLDEVPVIVADDLTEDQIQSFRLVDNKVTEFSKWDFELLRSELETIELDMGDFGFESISEVDWDSVDDLTDDTYEEPQKEALQCPHCGHKDKKTNFEAVMVDADEIEDDEEE